MHTVGGGVKYPSSVAESLSTIHATLIPYIQGLWSKSKVVILYYIVKIGTIVPSNP